MSENVVPVSLDNGMHWRATSDGFFMDVDEAEMKVVERDYLSPSSASSISRCPASLAADRICSDASMSPFDPAPLGTRAHEVMEELYQLSSKERTKVRARSLVTENVNAAGLDRLDRLFMMSATWKRVRRLWDIEDPQRVLVRRTEWKLQNFAIPTPSGPVPFTGIIDRVDIVGDENSVGSAPVDYKAGAGRIYFPRNGDVDDKAHQIRLYAAAMEEFDGRLPLGGKLYFTYHGKARSVSVQKGKVDDTRAWFGKAWQVTQDAFDKKSFKAVPNKLCPWCPVSETCPAFSEALKVDTESVKKPKKKKETPRSKVKIFSMSVDSM